MSLRTVVAGGGLAGLTTALLLARAGLRVEVLEADGAPPEPHDLVAVRRRQGAPHIAQPHIYPGIFRRQLLERLPDVYACILDEGAQIFDATGTAGPASPYGDLAGRGGAAIQADRFFLSCPATAVELALHRALASEPLASVRYGARVRGVHGDIHRVKGVLLANEMVAADTVVDALGRCSPLAPDYTMTLDEVDCGVVHRTRFYRTRNLAVRPLFGGGLVTVAGDGFSARLAEQSHGTFAITLRHLAGDRALERLGTAVGFTRALSVLPDVGDRLTADAVPVSDVLTGQDPPLVLRRLDPHAPVGYLAVGDALCSVDAETGGGAALALDGAIRVARALVRPQDGRAPGVEPQGDHSEQRLRGAYERSARRSIVRTRLWEATVTQGRDRAGNNGPCSAGAPLYGAMVRALAP
ncbi:NAD(P)-binding protein [Streptomyces sp. NPDC057539]|uniref:NAD(P)-binding protein n=1 Tax=Streptomyces sp. NPDC057539 TaxID=3346159 RepID=UPI0036C343E4